jgi:hypothetical protein
MHVTVNGRACKEYSHNGNTYIEARNGTNYTVKIKNDNPYRVMTVVSVDGLDVVSGKNAAETDTGYIINAYDSLEIKGYRINDDDCASFIFTSRGKSYVQNVKGDARNCGVIGLRAFREKPTYSSPINIVPLPYITPATYTTSPYYVYGSTTTSVLNTSNVIHKVDDSGTTYSAASSPMATAYNCSMDCSTPLNNSVKATSLFRSANFDTGTGWGNKIEQSVTRVSFEKGTTLTEMVMYYASKEALVEMGVDIAPKPKVAAMPQAFGYCTPPKGWVG